MMEQEEDEKTQDKLPNVEIIRVGLDEMISKQLEDHYEILTQVGQGTYGSVFKACSKNDPSKFFALKHLNTSKEVEGFPITAMREMKILQKLDHENILKIREVVIKNYGPMYSKRYAKTQQTYIVLDYMEHDFQGLLKNKVKFTETQVKCLILQLLKGMDHLHKNNIIHRDLKSANLLLNANGILKIADFGFARSIEKPLSRPLTPIVVTLWYRAPEILLGHGIYDEKSDVWSIGCFMIELLKMEPYFRGSNEKEQVDSIFQACGTPSEEEWPGFTNLRHYDELKPEQLYETTFKQTMFDKIEISDMGLEFLSKMMILNPSKRISTEEALQHPYFQTEPLPCGPEELPNINQECHEQLMSRERQQMVRKNMNQSDHIPQKKRIGQQINQQHQQQFGQKPFGGNQYNKGGNQLIGKRKGKQFD